MQMNRPHPVPTSATNPREPVFTEPVRVRSLRFVLRRNLLLVATVTGAGVAIAGLSTLVQKETFESEATIQFDGQSTGDRLGALASLAGLGALARETAGPVAVSIPVLTSRLIAEAVADSLRLHVELVHPAAIRDSILEVVSAPRDARPGEYSLTRDPTGRYQIRTVSGPAANGEIAVPGEVVALGDVTLRLRSTGPEPVEQIRLEVRPFRSAVADMRKELRVSTAGAQVVSVRFRSPDPLLAAEVPNSVAARFIQYSSETATVDSRNTVAFLRDQVALYETQLRAAEAELQSFREEAGVVSLPQEVSGQAGRLADLQVRRDEILAERRALADLLARADRGAPGEPSPYRQLASFPIFFSNGAVQGILQALTQLENRRSDLLVRRTPENDEVQAVNARIRELERQLYDMAQSYQQSRETQLASLEGTLAQFSERVRSVPERELAVARLAREARLLEEVYTMLHTRLKEAQIRDAAEPSGLRILDAALIPTRPIFPRPIINIGLGLVLGLLVAGGIVFLRELTDTRIRDEGDLRVSATGLPLLGAIPLLPDGRHRLSRSAGRALGLAPAASRAQLVTRTSPQSNVSEAYRALRTSILLGSPPSDQAQVIALASALPGEGKSTIAGNLCVSLVQQGTRTLLVDCDLHQGMLHELLDVPSAPGLANVLAGEVSPAAAIRDIPVAGAETPLRFLGAGVRSATSGELLDSRRIHDLLTELRAAYDLIILDTPPLRLVADGIVLAAAADTTILVAREGATDREALQGITAQLQQLGVHLSGLVLNGASEAGGIRHYGMYASARSSKDVGEPTRVS